MKYNFSQVTYKDIEGKEVEGIEFPKTIAKILFSQCHKDLELSDLARIIYSGEEVELDKVQIESVKKIVTGDNSFQDASVKKAVVDYIESVKKK